MPKPSYQARQQCRICHSASLTDFLDLGEMPPVNAFTETTDTFQTSYPLVVAFCRSCSHVQLRNTVNRAALFQDYTYFSSASEPLIKHFDDYADEIERKFLDEGETVVEIGCNDGILLDQFSNRVQCLGVEPAQNVATVARKQYGLDIRTEFFDADMAADISDEIGTANAVLANNVVGHIDDLHDFMDGIELMLKADGVFIMEVPYVYHLLNNLEFDTIYHEHISYFSVHTLQRLVNQFNLEIFDIKRVDTQGGSLRMYIQPDGGSYNVSRYVKDLLRLERAHSMTEVKTFERFSEAVKQLGKQLRNLLVNIAEQDCTLVGYGAPAKGNVLLNYCNLGPEHIDFVIDTTPRKQHTYTPGTKIPVRPAEAFSDPYPEYALLLAWNYRSAILQNEREFREVGGRFIVPQPSVDII
jgi:D-mycarose 3-C-methyltransferase